MGKALETVDGDPIDDGHYKGPLLVQNVSFWLYKGFGLVKVVLG